MTSSYFQVQHTCFNKKKKKKMRADYSWIANKHKSYSQLLLLLLRP